MAESALQPVKHPKKPPEAALKQLEWLQAIITRMANNSFLIKGWGTTVAAGLFALAAKDSERKFAILAVYPALVFWCLDANYLRLERMFRAKYEKVAEELDMGLSVTASPPATFARSFFAGATWPIYVTVLVIAGLIALNTRA